MKTLVLDSMETLATAGEKPARAHRPARILLRARAMGGNLSASGMEIAVLEFHRDLHLTVRADRNSRWRLESVVEIRFDTPDWGPEPAKVRVEKVLHGEEEGIRIGLRILSMSLDAHQSLVRHLIHAEGWTPAQARKAGFRVRSLKGMLQLGLARSPGEYAAVLQLRRDAYVRVGKRDPSTLPAQMISPLDGISRILTATHNGKLVGCMAFIFPTLETTVLDTQSGFPAAKYPVSLPPKSSLIDVARLCVHEDYRGTDIVQQLFAQGFLEFAQSDRKMFLTSATRDMLPFYLSVGFRPLGAVYNHPLLQGREHHLIGLTKESLYCRLSMNLLDWNLWYGEAARTYLAAKPKNLSLVESMALRGRLLFETMADNRKNHREAREFQEHFASRAKRFGVWKTPNPSPGKP